MYQYLAFMDDPPPEEVFLMNPSLFTTGASGFPGVPAASFEESRLSMFRTSLRLTGLSTGSTETIFIIALFSGDERLFQASLCLLASSVPAMILKRREPMAQTSLLGSDGLELPTSGAVKGETGTPLLPARRKTSFPERRNISGPRYPQTIPEAWSPVTMLSALPMRSSARSSEKPPDAPMASQRNFISAASKRRSFLEPGRSLTATGIISLYRGPPVLRDIGNGGYLRHHASAAVLDPAKGIAPLAVYLGLQEISAAAQEFRINRHRRSNWELPL